MSESKAREFWIDSAPLFNGLDMYPYKKAFDNIQDAEEMIVGNTYHVIEHSAFVRLQEELEYTKRLLADERSGDCDKDKTIRRLERNLNNALSENAILRKALELAVKSGEFFSRHADCRNDSWSCRCEFCKDNSASKNLREARETLKELGHD